jgi:regulatory protein
VRRRALALLARREHSAFELGQKLRHKGLSVPSVEGVIEQLIAEGLLSDQRFAESLIYSRRQQGYGPVRIRYELREKGVDEDIVDSCLNQVSDWGTVIREVRENRFGVAFPVEAKERARQVRFLLNRGFDGEQVRELLSRVDESL